MFSFFQAQNQNQGAPIEHARPRQQVASPGGDMSDIVPHRTAVDGGQPMPARAPAGDVLISDSTRPVRHMAPAGHVVEEHHIWENCIQGRKREHCERAVLPAELGGEHIMPQSATPPVPHTMPPTARGSVEG